MMEGCDEGARAPFSSSQLALGMATHGLKLSDLRPIDDGEYVSLYCRDDDGLMLDVMTGQEWMTGWYKDEHVRIKVSTIRHLRDPKADASPAPKVDPIKLRGTWLSGAEWTDAHQDAMDSGMLDEVVAMERGRNRNRRTSKLVRSFCCAILNSHDEPTALVHPHVVNVIGRGAPRDGYDGWSTPYRKMTVGIPAHGPCSNCGVEVVLDTRDYEIPRWRRLDIRNYARVAWP